MKKRGKKRTAAAREEKDLDRFAGSSDEEEGRGNSSSIVPTPSSAANGEIVAREADRHNDADESENDCEADDDEEDWNDATRCPMSIASVLEVRSSDRRASVNPPLMLAAEDVTAPV